MDHKKEEYIKHAQSGKYNVCIWGAGFLGTQKGLQMLNAKGISVDFYCDNNRELWGKEIINQILCISPMELEQKTQYCLLSDAYKCIRR